MLDGAVDAPNDGDIDGSSCVGSVVSTVDKTEDSIVGSSLSGIGVLVAPVVILNDGASDGRAVPASVVSADDEMEG